jgi:hypothetical protein
MPERHDDLAGVPVVYSEVPVRLHLAGIRHRQQLLAALLGAAAGPAAGTDLAEFVQALAATLARYSWVDDEAVEQARLARFIGGDRFDFHVELPPEAAEDFATIAESLEHLDLHRVRGATGWPSASPAVAGLRRWYAEETGRQLAGARPTSCPF